MSSSISSSFNTKSSQELLESRLDELLASHEKRRQGREDSSDRHPRVTDATVNGVAIGKVDFDADLGGGQADEVAYMILFLLSDESTFSTGSEFVCDGGLTA